MLDPKNLFSSSRSSIPTAPAACNAEICYVEQHQAKKEFAGPFAQGMLQLRVRDPTLNAGSPIRPPSPDPPPPRPGPLRSRNRPHDRWHITPFNLRQGSVEHLLCKSPRLQTLLQGNGASGASACGRCLWAVRVGGACGRGMSRACRRPRCFCHGRCVWAGCAVGRRVGGRASGQRVCKRGVARRVGGRVGVGHVREWTAGRVSGQPGS